MSKIRIPTATYRIQFNQNYRFADARDLVPYLHDLGISDLYASPRFKARRGSSHGYDVANPLRINSELGTNEDFDELCERLHKYGMGLLLDIVPNHMAASPENPWWLDVLENGPGSVYASFFDIDWHPAASKAAFLQEEKVLLPMLGDLYGNVLENQELALKLDENGLYVRYYEARLPLDPKTYPEVLEQALPLARAGGKEAEEAARQLELLVEAARRLPSRSVTHPEEQSVRRRDKEEIKRRLWELYLGDMAAREALDETLRIFNGVRGEPESFDPLDALLGEQAFRVASWRIGNEEINYRRFFDINDLVGLRVEDTQVFEARHAEILQLVAEEKVSGLRVDHIDGLERPQEYLERLQASASAAYDRGDPETSLYIVVEKILGRDEELSPDWPVCGTTGYDFLNALNGLFIDPDGLERIDDGYRKLAGDGASFEEVCYAANRKVMDDLFAGDVNSLVHHLGKIAAKDRRARDVPLSDLRAALVEVTARLPVYRTYISEAELSEQDRSYLVRTLESARSHTSEDQIGSAAFAFLRQVFLNEPVRCGPPPRDDCLRFTRRWQQFTGAVMAKGLEDTTLYVYNSLLSLNEVGSDPLRVKPPFDLDAFHSFNRNRLARWPHTLNATSTHDTKRSEDARARIDVLSELPEAWEQSLRRWGRRNRRAKLTVDGAAVPSASEESMIYQSLIGIWPFDAASLPDLKNRMTEFVVKAAREAKENTSWLHPDEDYEHALVHFVESILETEGAADRFLKDFVRFQKKIAWYGALNSLSQVLLKIASPGVPDLYQGTELWNLHLVDPDNRQPVNFQKRRRFLEEIRSREAADLPKLLEKLLHHWADGRVKMYEVYKALNFRRLHPELFQKGDYLPLRTAGARQGNVCAFARRWNDSWAVVLAPLKVTELGPVTPRRLGEFSWEDASAALPDEAPLQWENIFTGETIPAGPDAVGGSALSLETVFNLFPVALLYGKKPAGTSR